MVAAALLFLSALRPQIETLHPAAASACAMPRPMPPLPPVMMATRPLRSKMFMGISLDIFLGAFQVVRRAWDRASDGQCCEPNHGQGRPENQIWRQD
jgi:hypothetical protein